MKVSFAKLFYPIASCFFMVLLFLPFLDERFHFMPVATNNELRELAKAPRINKDSIAGFPKAFEAFYTDNFGFRGTLVNIDSKIKYYLFRSSPVIDRVAIGKNDVLFLTGRYYKITQDLNRENDYTDEGLEELVKLWEERKQELGDRGISYYKAFWPDKHYIYPEMLPFGMKAVDLNLPHRCDQAIEYLKKNNSSVQIIDVRNELLEAKKRFKVFHKYDSHWNSYGAFTAYTKLLNVVAMDFPEIKPLDYSDFIIDWKLRGGYDLANTINIELAEAQPVFTPIKNRDVVKTVTTEGYPIKTSIFVNDSSTTDLTALVYRDSFTTTIIPFLMMNFRKIVFIWDTEYSIEMVEKVKPDIVMECYASRYFR